MRHESTSLPHSMSIATSRQYRVHTVCFARGGRRSEACPERETRHRGREIASLLPYRTSYIVYIHTSVDYCTLLRVENGPRGKYVLPLKNKDSMMCSLHTAARRH